MFGIRVKTGHKDTAEDLRVGKTIAYVVPSWLSLAMRLDTSRGRCPKKVLPIGDTTFCFYTYEAEQAFRPRKSTLLDGPACDGFLHVSRTYPYTHNCQAFQRITRKIGMGYPRDNYACNTLAIVSARILCVPLLGGQGGSGIMPGKRVSSGTVGSVKAALYTVICYNRGVVEDATKDDLQQGMHELERLAQSNGNGHAA